MDPESLRIVEEAAAIGTSGRWTRLNGRIKTLIASATEANVWHIELFGSLCSTMFVEYLLLKTAYNATPKCDPPLLAWRARNLLELSVWARYCATSAENARRLYEDAGRDVAGLYEVYRKWGAATGQTDESMEQLNTARQEFFAQAASRGVDSLEGSFTRVSDAASDCGIRDHFDISFRTLSKFAHPTAMRILGSANEATENLQRDEFFGQGCLFFIAAFNALEKHLM